MSARFCAKCGHKLEAGQNFCVECGKATGGKLSGDRKSAAHAPQSLKSLLFARETLIVIGAVGVIAAGFFIFKKQEPLPVADSPTSRGSGQKQLSMAMIDALPQDYGTLVQMGNEYMDQMNFAVATQIYSRALEIDGSSSDVRTDYGACLHGMGMPERAIEEFKKVVTADPAHAIAHFNIGIVYSELQKSDSAIVYFQHYLDREPDGRASDAAKRFLADLGK